MTDFYNNIIKLKIPIIEQDTIKNIKNYIDIKNITEIYKGKLNNITVILKYYSPNRFKSITEYEHNIFKEIFINKIIKNINIPLFYGLYFKSGKLFMVFQYINGITFDKFIKINYWNNKLIKKYLIQLLKVINYLHTRNIIHCDIKPENILISKNRLYLIDYGCALYCKHNEFTIGYNGSYYWMAPEVMNNRLYNYKCDIYSFGKIIEYIAIFTNITKYLNINNNVLSLCLQNNYYMRPEVDDIIKLLRLPIK